MLKYNKHWLWPTPWLRVENDRFSSRGAPGPDPLSKVALVSVRTLIGQLYGPRVSGFSVKLYQICKSYSGKMNTKISISFQWILLPLFYAISRVIKEQVFHYGNHTNNISKGFSFPLACLFRIGTNPVMEGRGECGSKCALPARGASSIPSRFLCRTSWLDSGSSVHLCRVSGVDLFGHSSKKKLRLLLTE